MSAIVQCVDGGVYISEFGMEDGMLVPGAGYLLFNNLITYKGKVTEGKEVPLLGIAFKGVPVGKLNFLMEAEGVLGELLEMHLFDSTKNIPGDIYPIFKGTEKRYPCVRFSHSYARDWEVFITDTDLPRYRLETTQHWLLLKLFPSACVEDNLRLLVTKYPQEYMYVYKYIHPSSSEVVYKRLTVYDNALHSRLTDAFTLEKGVK